MNKQTDDDNEKDKIALCRQAGIGLGIIQASNNAMRKKQVICVIIVQDERDYFYMIRVRQKED